MTTHVLYKYKPFLRTNNFEEVKFLNWNHIPVTYRVDNSELWLTYLNGNYFDGHTELRRFKLPFEETVRKMIQNNGEVEIENIKRLNTWPEILTRVYWKKINVIDWDIMTHACSESDLTKNRIVFEKDIYGNYRNFRCSEDTWVKDRSWSIISIDGKVIPKDEEKYSTLLDYWKDRDQTIKSALEIVYNDLYEQDREFIQKFLNEIYGETFNIQV